MTRSRLRSLLPALSAVILWSCGSSNGGSSGNGGSDGGGSTGSSGGCTVTVSGDATSGVSQKQWACGWSKDLTTNSDPVEYTISLYSGMTLWGPTFQGPEHAGFTFLSTTPMTAPMHVALQNGTTQYTPAASYSVPTGPQVWAWTQGNAFEFTLTSVTPTAVSDCASTVNITSVYSPSGCFKVHGTAHMVMGPITLTGGNQAKGTVTADWTF